MCSPQVKQLVLCRTTQELQRHFLSEQPLGSKHPVRISSVGHTVIAIEGTRFAGCRVEPSDELVEGMDHRAQIDRQCWVEIGKRLRPGRERRR